MVPIDEWISEEKGKWEERQTNDVLADSKECCSSRPTWTLKHVLRHETG